MANFPPLKKHIFYCIDKALDTVGIKSPFLDVGCGVGDLSEYLGQKNWYGRAIDQSNFAYIKACELLSSFSEIDICQKSIFNEHNLYKSIFLLDVLEHIKDDKRAMEKIYSLLEPCGHVVMVVPSNPKEWRWDDEFYGHYRRYSPSRIVSLLNGVHLKPIIIWDITYPFYWLMRRVYTKIKKKPEDIDNNMYVRTSMSSTVNAWEFPVLLKFILNQKNLWNQINKLQFLFFKNNVQQGHEMLIIARKIR
jgi:SAM-dependent methyltransferase|tara:strand:+ start:30 stop:776 length:747 start_codon:yes stop_codon:yes gene_type:complete